VEYMTCGRTSLPVKAVLLVSSMVNITLIRGALLMQTCLPAAQADLHQFAERHHIHVRPGRRDGPPPGAGADLLHVPGAFASAPAACVLITGTEQRPESGVTRGSGAC
jgi:hypothetical protein